MIEELFKSKSEVYQLKQNVNTIKIVLLFKSQKKKKNRNQKICTNWSFQIMGQFNYQTKFRTFRNSEEAKIQTDLNYFVELDQSFGQWSSVEQTLLYHCLWVKLNLKS